MENNINIAEILKDCPEGMKLYSPLYGEVTFSATSESGETIEIYTYNKYNVRGFDYLNSDGHLYSQMQNVSYSLPQKCEIGASSSSEGMRFSVIPLK